MIDDNVYKSKQRIMTQSKFDWLPFWGTWILGSLILFFIISWLVMYIVYWGLSLIEMLFLCLGDRSVKELFSPPLGAIVCETTGWQCWGWILVTIWTIICICMFTPVLDIIKRKESLKYLAPEEFHEEVIRWRKRTGWQHTCIVRDGVLYYDDKPVAMKVEQK